MQCLTINQSNNKMNNLLHLLLGLWLATSDSVVTGSQAKGPVVNRRSQTTSRRTIMYFSSASTALIRHFCLLLREILIMMRHHFPCPLPLPLLPVRCYSTLAFIFAGIIILLFVCCVFSFLFILFLSRY